jgi:hypothetical protein
MRCFAVPRKATIRLSSKSQTNRQKYAGKIAGKWPTISTCKALIRREQGNSLVELSLLALNLGLSHLAMGDALVLSQLCPTQKAGTLLICLKHFSLKSAKIITAATELI